MAMEKQNQPNTNSRSNWYTMKRTLIKLQHEKEKLNWRKIALKRKNYLKGYFPPRPVRLMVRTSGFQPGNRGSIPLRATNSITLHLYSFAGFSPKGWPASGWNSPTGYQLFVHLFKNSMRKTHFLIIFLFVATLFSTACSFIQKNSKQQNETEKEKHN